MTCDPPCVHCLLVDVKAEGEVSTSRERGWSRQSRSCNPKSAGERRHFTQVLLRTLERVFHVTGSRVGCFAFRRGGVMRWSRWCVALCIDVSSQSNLVWSAASSLSCQLLRVSFSSPPKTLLAPSADSNNHIPHPPFCLSFSLTLSFSLCLSLLPLSLSLLPLLVVWSVHIVVTTVSRALYVSQHDHPKRNTRWFKCPQKVSSHVRHLHSLTLSLPLSFSLLSFGCEAVVHVTRQWSHTFRDDSRPGFGACRSGPMRSIASQGERFYQLCVPTFHGLLHGRTHATALIPTLSSGIL